MCQTTQRLHVWGCSYTVNIKITLGGAFLKLLPESEKGNSFHLTLEHPAKIQDVLNSLGVSENQRLLCILNNTVVNRKHHQSTELNDGDALSLMPPITAG